MAQPEHPTPLFVVYDEHELFGLFEALWEAKFHPDPEKPEVQGSPFVAAAITRALDALIALKVGRGREGVAAQYRAHRQVLPHFVGFVRRELKGVRDQTWQAWSLEEKVNYIRLMLAPMIPDTALVSTLVAERDAELAVAPDAAHT